MSDFMIFVGVCAIVIISVAAAGYGITAFSFHQSELISATNQSHLSLIEQRETLKTEIVKQEMESLSHYEHGDYKAVMADITSMTSAMTDLQKVYEQMIEVKCQ